MSLISNNFTANSAPSTAKIVVLQEDVDSVTLNTDLIFSVSSDGGSNWDEVNLSYSGNYSSTQKILTGSTSLTMSGTDMKYNISTYNDKELKIHGVGMTWS
jgi:hypothetical protein